MNLEDVEKAKKGDKEAFERIVMANIDSLYRVGHGFFQNDDDVYDAVQATVLKAFTKIKKMKNAEFFKTWITRILINECNQIIRQKKKVIYFEDYKTEDGFTEMNYNNIELKNIISNMKEDLRLITVLYYIEDFKTLEIAEILKIPEGTVKSRLHTAREIISKEYINKKGVIQNERRRIR